MDPAMPAPADEKSYRRGWISWALYDVANSSYYLTVMTAIFPLFYKSIYLNVHPGATGTKAASSLAYTASIAMVVVAVLGPVLGAVADRVAAKKKLLAFFAGVGVVSCGLMFFIGDRDLGFAALLYATAMVGAAGSIVFYDALLPSVARPADVDRISTIGFAAGYLGSVLLFIANIVLVSHPDWFGEGGKGLAVRLSFLSVAVWWAIFTIPVLRNVPEPPAPGGGRVPPGRLLLEGFRQLAGTFRKIRAYKQLLLFLAAYWIYIDGIGTIMKLATAFGSSLKIGDSDLLLALVLTQIVGVPCALAFGWIARRTGPKPAILGGLAVYAGICVMARLITLPWHFYAMAVSVGLVQGGVQALSRSLFASFTPKDQAGEFFGFFSTMEKFAGILGPFVLGLAWSEGDDPRRGILLLVFFFIVGGALLWKVNVAEGRRAAGTAGGP